LLACDSPNWDHATDREKFRLGGDNATTLCVDLDNDGKMDLLTGTIKHWWAGSGADTADVLLNVTGTDGQIKFDRPGREKLGVVVPHKLLDYDEGIMTANALDFDNDGKVDFYWSASDYPNNRGLLYHQEAKATDGKPQFSLVDPIKDGIDQHRSLGIAVADIDRDGDLDVIVGHSQFRCGSGGEVDDTPCYPTDQVRIFENVTPHRGNFVQLTLLGNGTNTNAAAIGARVQVKATIHGEEVTQTQEVSGGFGQYGYQNDLTLHFGIADACDTEVTVRWPNKALETQTFHVAAGYRYVVEQGKDPKPVHDHK
jgi:hypothetical protein